MTLGCSENGKPTLVSLSREVAAEYGRDCGCAELARTVAVAYRSPGEAMVVTLSQPLSWPHVRALLPMEDPLARDSAGVNAYDREPAPRQVATAEGER